MGMKSTKSPDTPFTNIEDDYNSTKSPDIENNYISVSKTKDVTLTIYIDY